MRLICVLGIGLALAGCFGGGYTPSPEPVDNAPSTSQEDIQRLANLADPEVTGEAKSRGGNGPVYTVFGKTYRVMSDANGFQQKGTASWYGTKFHGRPTANGEKYDIYKLTAAHKHLPIPTYVRVTNLGNGKKTVVRVNDRGPFHDNRVIDLSYAAAVKLDFHTNGTAEVLVEVLNAVQVPDVFYVVQAGAFSQLASADRSEQELRSLTGLSGVVVRNGGDGLYRVQLGPVKEGKELDRVKSLLLATDYGAPRLIRAKCQQQLAQC